jgi:multiple sugar transport system substrate-binding protein
MKKVLALLITLTMVFGLFSSMAFAKTTKAAPYVPSGTLTVWSFTTELQDMAKYYTKEFPNVKINYVMTPTAQYPQKLTPALSSANPPDVFALESAFVKQYIPDTKDLADLSSLEPDVKAANLYKYSQDVGRDSKGVLRGLAWQATPGAMFYRRSLAKKYLGTDDPVKIQAMVSDFTKFQAVGEKLKTASNGRVKLLSSNGDLYNLYKAARKTGWESDGKFVIDPKITEYFKTAKIFKDKGYEAEQAQWGEGWFAGMNGSLKDVKGKPQDIFAYLLPTWGLHYVLKPNATNAKTKITTAGDWAMVQGPAPYFWGGTWVSASAKSPNLELAKHFIAWITTNQKFLTQYVKDSGDFVGSQVVVNKVKSTFSNPFLKGQNDYVEFAKMAPSITAKNLTGDDQNIETLMNAQLTDYTNGKVTLDKAMSNLKANVANQFSDLEVN